MAESLAPLIVIIDDEYPVRLLLQINLEARGYRVVTAATGQAGIDSMDLQPQVILLDLGLPDMNGTSVIARLRAWTDIPIVVISACHDESQKVMALDLGANDYVTKPFGTEELLARIRVALRWDNRQAPIRLHVETGQLRIDLVARQIHVASQEVHLTPTEYQVLRVLAVNLGRVLSHGAILREVWGAGYDQETQLLRGFVAQIRHKLEPDQRHPTYLLTVPGIGYRLVDYGQADPAGR